jgi:hypothetical protein
MPDYDHAYALFQAELAGGDTDPDTEMRNFVNMHGEIARTSGCLSS